jgi:hypothetical protein
VIPDQRLALSQGLEDVDRRFEDGARARPPLAGELSALASLADLDSGLADGDVNADAFVRPPSIMARLVIPDTRQHREQPSPQSPAALLGPDRTTGYVSARMTALGLTLAKFFGAASGAVVLHERPPQIPVQRHTLPPKPETRERGKLEEVEKVEGLLKSRHEELAERPRAPGPLMPGQDDLTARIAELKQTLETIAQQLAAH